MCNSHFFPSAVMSPLSQRNFTVYVGMKHDEEMELSLKIRQRMNTRNLHLTPHLELTKLKMHSNNNKKRTCFT